MGEMRDIDVVVQKLCDVIYECDRQHRHGDGLTHSTTGWASRTLEEAVDILEAWPAKVYAIGVPPVEQERE